MTYKPRLFKIAYRKCDSRGITHIILQLHNVVETRGSVLFNQVPATWNWLRILIIMLYTNHLESLLTL